VGRRNFRLGPKRGLLGDGQLGNDGALIGAPPVWRTIVSGVWLAVAYGYD
jgi:hypothetical protein